MKEGIATLKVQQHYLVQRIREEEERAREHMAQAAHYRNLLGDIGRKLMGLKPREPLDKGPLEGELIGYDDLRPELEDPQAL